MIIFTYKKRDDNISFSNSLQTLKFSKRELYASSIPTTLTFFQKVNEILITSKKFKDILTIILLTFHYPYNFIPPFMLVIHLLEGMQTPIMQQAIRILKRSNKQNRDSLVLPDKFQMNLSLKSSKSNPLKCKYHKRGEKSPKRSLQRKGIKVAQWHKRHQLRIYCLSTRSKINNLSL